MPRKEAALTLGQCGRSAMVDIIDYHLDRMEVPLVGPPPAVKPGTLSVCHGDAAAGGVRGVGGGVARAVYLMFFLAACSRGVRC